MEVRLSERFVSIQGEARWVGRLSVFVRLVGCNLVCPWCDTHLKRNATNEVLTIEELVEWIRAQKTKHVVITGGEPLYEQQEVTVRLIEMLSPEFTFEVETNGTLPIPESLLQSNVYINVSPKLYLGIFERPQNLDKANYIVKFVVESEEDLDRVALWVDAWHLDPSIVYLMPNSRTYVEYIARSKKVLEWCKERGYNFSPRLQLVHYID